MLNKYPRRKHASNNHISWNAVETSKHSKLLTLHWSTSK